MTVTTVVEGEEWGSIERRGRRARFGSGDVLFREGGTDRSVFAIVSGQVKISLVTPSGRELLLAVKTGNDLVGEFAALDGRPRSATATALDDIETIVLTADQFDAVLDDHPSLARRLLRALAFHLREADWRTADREGGDTLARVARRVLILADRYGEHSGDSVSILLRLTQEDLAAWVGATREATSRALSRLRAVGAVETGRRRLTVTDVQKLREFAG